MKIEIRRNRVELIPENGSDKEALSTNIQVILNNNSGLVKYVKNSSERDRRIIWDIVWRVYCAGTSDGRMARQIEIDSHSYQA